MHVDPVGRRPQWAHLRTLVVGAGACLILLTAGCSSGAPMVPSGDPVHPVNGARSASIAITGFTFVPGTVTVLPGATVTVVNRDDVTHTLTSPTGGFDTGGIAPGATASFSAPDHSGRYAYICSIHQYMTGTIVVT